MFTLEQVMKVQRGIEVKLYSFFNLCDRWGGWLTLRHGSFTPGNDTVPII
jgi:hypothetical protein